MLPPPWVMLASSPAISLSRSSSRMSGRTMNMTSYVRCIAVLQFFLLVAWFAAIELIHCRAGPLGQHHLYRLRRTVQNLIEDRQLRLAHRREHIILAPPPRSLCRLIARGSDPDPNPQPLFATQGAGDRLHSVMPPRTTPLPDAQRAQGKSDLVINHNQIAGIELFHQRLNRDAAQVHVRLRLGQNHFSAGDAGSGGQPPAAAVGYGNATLLRQPVDG